MRIQREALIKEFGYKPNPGENDLLLNNLRDKLQLLEKENKQLREQVCQGELEKQAFLKQQELAHKEGIQKNRLILELQNNIARLRNEIWKTENSKAPVQIFAFTLFIVVIILLFVSF